MPAMAPPIRMLKPTLAAYEAIAARSLPILKPMVISEAKRRKRIISDDIPFATKMPHMTVAARMRIVVSLLRITVEAEAIKEKANP
jgi:hypothetical protein